MRRQTMELIRISDTHLKVMLSAEDMATYKLNCDTIEQEKSPSRKAFWEILTQARHRTGFDTAGGRVFVQMYPEKSGGCELFVTVLETEAVYRFSSLTDLLQACKRMQAAHSVSVSRAFVDERKRYFYLATDRTVPYLTEYDAQPCGRLERDYIKEHCRCFCRDAAGTLGAFV